MRALGFLVLAFLFIAVRFMAIGFWSGWSKLHNRIPTEFVWMNGSPSFQWYMSWFMISTSLIINDSSWIIFCQTFSSWMAIVWTLCSFSPNLTQKLESKNRKIRFLFTYDCLIVTFLVNGNNNYLLSISFANCFLPGFFSIFSNLIPSFASKSLTNWSFFSCVSQWSGHPLASVLYFNQVFTYGENKPCFVWSSTKCHTSWILVIL